VLQKFESIFENRNYESEMDKDNKFFYLALPSTLLLYCGIKQPNKVDPTSFGSRKENLGKVLQPDYTNYYCNLSAIIYTAE